MSQKEPSEIPVSPQFHEFIPGAIMRLNYLYPGLSIEITASGVKLIGDAEIDVLRLEREVTYQIYREKIYQQTLPMRRDLYQMLAM